MRSTCCSFRNCIAVLLASMFICHTASAFTSVIDSATGLNDNEYAMGRFVDVDADVMSTWTLQTTVDNTDFTNDMVTGGDHGVEYVMLNSVQNSSDVNSIRFAVQPAIGFSVENISISQSPYNNDPNTWNGGNGELAQFVVSWAGDGVAMLSDPDNQIFGLTTGMPIVSGTTVRFNSGQALNSEDTWRLTMPAGVDEVQVNWSSANPSAASDLTREWVAFDATFAAVPEPAAAILMGLAGLLGFFQVRRSRQ